jgi:hypothetical protein
VSAALAAMFQICFDDFVTGQWDDALRLADEGLEPRSDSTGLSHTIGGQFTSPSR